MVSGSTSGRPTSACAGHCSELAHAASTASDAPRYAEHHRVKITDDALRSAVELSGRYITGRVQPDKSIDVIDEAGARALGPSGKQDSCHGGLGPPFRP